jgi:hypothetical protein
MPFKEQELIAVYNEAPNSLLGKVVKVAVKPESITTNYRDSITLANIGNGNYWIIYDADINYWLLPKAKLRIDRYRYETVKLLFDCNEYEPEYHSFKLDRPALLSILANQSEWKLERRGKLKFNYPSINQELPEKDESENSFISFSENKIDRSLRTSVYTELLYIYNNNPQLLEKNAIKVLETTNSISRKRAGISQQIVLEAATKSNYWVVYDNQDKNCWLFLKNSMRISQYRHQDIQALFKCYGYQPDYSNFELVKPAKLISLATEDKKWIVEELGILKFIL